MSLVSILQANDKTGSFVRTKTDVSYPTGFHTIDFRNGYYLDSYDENDEVTKTQRSIGIVAGSLNTVIGRSGAAKTTGVVQICMNIAAKFKNSHVQHYDLEGAFNYTRVKHVTGQPMSVLKEKYIIKKDQTYINDIYGAIKKIYDTKISMKKELQYRTGFFDEFGDEIETFEPTFVIIDSIPSIAINGVLENDELQTQSYGMQKSKALSDFTKNIIPLCKAANIIVFFINHINVKIEMNAFAKTQAQTMYLKQDESLPGGNAPIYYANNLFKFITSSKYVQDKHGFDGFMVKVELIKSRTNKAGQIAELIYDQSIGFDQARSLLNFAESLKLTTGNNPNRRFVNYPDVKYSSLKFTKQFNEKPELRNALFDTVLPYLDEMLSSKSELDNVGVSQEELMARLAHSLERDEGIVFSEVSEKVEEL